MMALPVRSARPKALATASLAWVTMESVSVPGVAPANTAPAFSAAAVVNGLMFRVAVSPVATPAAIRLALTLRACPLTGSM
jgi:hypothetical protein